jgi:hypothetical protein
MRATRWLFAAPLVLLALLACFVADEIGVISFEASLRWRIRAERLFELAARAAGELS